MLEALRRLERAAVAILMLLMAAAYALNVAVRELAAAHAARFAWIEEACLFALAWVVFLGLGLALERGRHIAMTSLLERLAGPLRRPVKLVIDLTGLAFSLYVAKLSLDITLFVARSGQASPTLDVSMGWLYAAMPVGFVLLGLRYVLELPQAHGRLAARAVVEGH
ncbi:MAG: TRAP transporter small permease [Betaproteobacteria bacterium]